MSDSEKTAGDNASTLAPASNGQLATPALSPISEHGDTSTLLPALDAVLESRHEESNPSPKERRGPGLAIQTNNVEVRERRKSSVSSPRATKLSPSQLQGLVSSPESLPIRPVKDEGEAERIRNTGISTGQEVGLGLDISAALHDNSAGDSTDYESRAPHIVPSVASIHETPGALNHVRPGKTGRSSSSPMISRKVSSSKNVKTKPQLTPLILEGDHEIVPNGNLHPNSSQEAVQASPMPPIIPFMPIPMPPMPFIPTAAVVAVVATPSGPRAAHSLAVHQTAVAVEEKVEILCVCVWVLWGLLIGGIGIGRGMGAGLILL